MTTNELEALGVELSRKCKWNGMDILEAAIAALTDANFHTEADILNQMADILNNDNATHQIKFELTFTEVGDGELPF